MNLPDKSIQDELPELKKLVRKSSSFFRENAKRFNEFRKFVYKTSITENEETVNNELGRPNIQTNILTAYQSRLRGEFSKQEPSIEVSKDEGSDIPDEVIQIVEGHLRHIAEEAKTANTQYNTYGDSLTGGYSALSVFTEYSNPMSFDQIIKVRKCKYTTMTGYDPLATEPHKCDGNYQFECYPLTKEDLKSSYDVDSSNIVFLPSSALEGFTWSFNNGSDDITLVCKMFKKKKKKIKILDVAGQKSMTKKEYEEFSEKWQSERPTEQLPIVARERETEVTTICRYIFMEKMVLEYAETDFNILPQPFVDGDSIDLYEENTGAIEQFTRPYCYDAKGGQQLKNLGVQCLAGYLEMMSQHKYIIKKEAIPQEKSYLDALTRVQKASTIVVNAFKDNNPDHAIPDPIIPVHPQAAPPEISNSISMADNIIQNVLGSYDAQLGINNNQLSSLAIVEGATQSNAAAMPFVVNYVQAWNQVALICVDLMPKYFKTPMTIPVIDKEGKRSSVKINQDGGVDFNYDSNQLKVKVTAGVNFAIQKSKALNQIIAMCQAAPGFAKFMESKGLKVLLDNFEVRGVDILKTLADEYMKEQEAAQQKQEKMQEMMMENNPKMMDAHSKQFSVQSDAQFKAKKLQLEEDGLGMKREIAEAQRDAALARANAEEVRAAADLKMNHLDMTHRHAKDALDFSHKVSSSEKKQTREEI